MSLALAAAMQIVLKATLVLLAAATVATAARRASAAGRHLVWACGLLVLLALPAFSLLLPAWSPAWLPAGLSEGVTFGDAGSTEKAAPTSSAVPSPVAGGTIGKPPAAVWIAANTIGETAANPLAGEATNEPLVADPKIAGPWTPPRSDLAASSASRLAAAADSSARYRTAGRLGVAFDSPAPGAPSAWMAAYRSIWMASPMWLGAIWLAGATIMAVSLGAGFFQRSRLARRASALRTGPCVAAARTAALDLQLQRPVTVLHGRSRTIPMTWGFLRPILYLPAEAASWSRPRLRAVALHELAHVKRVDSVSRTIAQAACALFWFHPLAWLAARRMLTEQERACDDVVLLAGVPPHAYAETLVSIARELGGPRPAVAGALALARRSNLESRLLSILDPLARRQKMTTLHRSLLLTTFVLAALPVAALQPAPAQLHPEAATAQAPAPALRTTARQLPAAAATVSAAPAPPSAIALQGGALAAGEIRLQAQGARRLRGEIERLALDDGGWLRLSEGDRHLEVAARDGDLEVTYLVANQSAELDAEAREWAEEILGYVSRRMTLRGNIFVSFERAEIERSPAPLWFAFETAELEFVMPEMAPLEIVFPEMAPLAPITVEFPEIVMPLAPITVEFPEIVMSLPPFSVEIPEIVMPDIELPALALDLPSLAIAGDFVRSSGWTDDEGNRILAVWLGRVRLAETIEALELGPDGLLLIDERAADGGHRRLYITGEEGAGPRFEWLIDGQEQPFAAAARAWLEPILRQLAERRPGAR